MAKLQQALPPSHPHCRLCPQLPPPSDLVSAECGPGDIIVIATVKRQSKHSIPAHLVLATSLLAATKRRLSGMGGGMTDTREVVTLGNQNADQLASGFHVDACTQTARLKGPQLLHRPHVCLFAMRPNDSRCGHATQVRGRRSDSSDSWIYARPKAVRT